jgi:hypothetical protein
MTIKRATTTILVISICFGVTGGLFGYALGVFAPAYYRGVFQAGNDLRFYPAQVGFGLGATQGLFCGAAVGSVVVLAVALSGSRNREGKPVSVSEIDFIPGSQRSFPVKRGLGILGVIATLLVVGVISFVVGAIIGQSQLYQNWTEEKIAKVRPILQKPQFAGINVEYSSAAQVYLSGALPSEKTYKELEEQIRFLFGNAEAKFMMSNVSVAQPVLNPDSPTR